MKTRYKVLIVIAALIIILVVGFTIAMGSIEKNLESLRDVNIKEIDLSSIADGTYRGSYGSLPVAATVEVVIQNARIADVTIVEHQNGQGSKAEVLAEQVVTQQRINLDTIAGATYSSKVILLAIQDALTF